MNALRLSAIAICATAAGGFGATLDEVLDSIAPDVKKWASVCVVGTRPDGTADFTWHDAMNSNCRWPDVPASAKNSSSFAENCWRR